MTAEVHKLERARRSRKRKSTLKVSPETLMRAKGLAARKAQEQKPHVFTFPQFPPQAVPKDPKLAMDAANFGPASWAQSVTLGWGVVADGFLGYPELAVLAQRPEFRNMVSTIAIEATREWIEIVAEGDSKGGQTSDRVKQLEDELGRLGVQQAFRTCAEYDGFYGRGHLYLDTGVTDDPAELKMPLSPDKAKLPKGLLAVRPIEPVWVYPISYESVDPLRPDWYNPTVWYVMGKEVHASRLLRFVGHEVPDLLKPAYAFGGLSLTQLAKPYVDIWLQTRQAVADLIKKFSIIWMSTDLANALAPGAGSGDVFDRMEFFNLVRNNLGVMMLNKGSEEIGHLAVPLSGLHELQSQAQEHMCSVSREPAIKLLGVQPAGFNASSEGELETWADYCHAFQESLFAPQLRAVIEIVQVSLWGEIDKSITWKFKPVRQMKESDIAEIQSKKATVHQTYLDAGVVSAEEVRQALADDEDSPYHGLDVDDVPEQAEGEEDLDITGAESGPENEGV